MKTSATLSFQQQLLRQREALLQQLEQMRGGDSRVDAVMEIARQGGDSPAQNLSERELEMILDERETAELRAIDAALQRIEDGHYGACTECGVEIPLERLQAAPEALRCVGCQGKFEH